MFKIGKFSNSIAINDEKNIIVVITKELTLMEYQNDGKDWNKVKMQKIQINDDAKIKDLCINSVGDSLSILTNKNLQIWVKKNRQVRWQRLRIFRFYLQYGEPLKLEASFQQQQVVNHAIMIFDTQPLLIKNFAFSLITRYEKLIHVETNVAQVYSVSNTLELIAKNLFDNDQIHIVNYRNIWKQYQILISESNLFKMQFSEKNQLVVVLVNKINIYQLIDNYFVLIESINLITNLLNKIFLNNDLCKLVGILENYYTFKSNQGILIFDVKTQKYYEQKKQKAKVIMSQNRETALIEVSFRHRGHGKNKKYQFRLLYLNHFADYLLIEQNPKGFLFSE